MSINDLRLFTQDARKAGENVARTIRILAKVFLDWSWHNAEHGSPEGVISNKPLPPLRAIEFDKLSKLFWRLWNELHRQRKVRFRGAFLQRRGFHGPGDALKINRKEDEILGKDPDDTRHSEWAYTTEIVEKLKPPWSDARVLFRVEGKSCNPKKCKIYPGLDTSLWDSWLSGTVAKDPESQFLTSPEVTYVQAISAVISELSKEEIRALGTHCSANETCGDISFNLKALNNRFNEIIGHLQRCQPEVEIDHAAYTMVTTAREILRKSKHNRKIYETARNKCKARLSGLGLQGHAVLNAFTAVQYPADSIWKDNFVSEIGKNAQVLVGFCAYCRRGLVSQRAISNLKAREIKEAEKAYKSLRVFAASMNITLPSYKQIESLSGPEWADVLNQVMARIVGSLPVRNRLHRLGVP
ncbi:MAG: hypothetical protein MUP16_05020 [Sedimentisphaerales bacterium]|nr:hypothetical protein [Sedimentisphaerales bacterium]